MQSNESNKGFIRLIFETLIGEIKSRSSYPVGADKNAIDDEGRTVAKQFGNEVSYIGFETVENHENSQ
jgi:hypothetical protein